MEKEETKGATVCVTGASGFFASWLVRRLLLAGYQVKGTVRDPGSFNNNLCRLCFLSDLCLWPSDDEKKVVHLWKLEGAIERLRLVKADLLDEGSFDDAVLGCQGVFHTASPVMPVRSNPISEIIDPTVKGTLNVLRSCKKNPSLRRVVLTSSLSTVRILAAGEFPTDNNNMLDESFWSSEEVCRKNQLWYPLAKMEAEKEAWKFAKMNEIDLVTVVPGFIVGPNLSCHLSHTSSTVLQFFQGNCRAFEPLGRIGYVHIDDVATCHVLGYENPSAHGRYLCSSTVLDYHQLTTVLSVVFPSIPFSKRYL